MNTCPNCGKVTGLHSSILQGCMCQYSMQATPQTQEPVSNDPLPRACNLAGVDYQTFLKIKAYMPVTSPQRTGQEPPKYSFKAHWEKDGRIGVVAVVERPDGGFHVLQDIIDAPKEKNT